MGASEVRIGYYKLAHSTARQGAAKACMELPDGTVVTFSEPTRSLDQNSKLWPMLGDIAEQVPWNVDGQLQLVADTDWKEILTAGLRKTQRVAQGIEGGFVLLGARTSKMSVREMSELIEFAYWFGSERDVVWSEPVETHA